MPSHDGSGQSDHETIRGVVMVSLEIQDPASPNIDRLVHLLRTLISTRVLQNMLFAGAEMQSTTLEWAMAHLLQHPDVMERAQAELNNVVGTHRLVQEADLEQLPYLKAVKRSLSHPTRRSACSQPQVPPAVSSSGVQPPKTRLICNIHSVHRDPWVHDRPDELNPSRFPKPPQNHDSSFGAGRRICPRLPLANINVPHFLPHLLHSFDWRFPGGQIPQELDMSEIFDGLTAPRLRSLLTLTKPRKRAFLY